MTDTIKSYNPTYNSWKRMRQTVKVMLDKSPNRLVENLICEDFNTFDGFLDIMGEKPETGDDGRRYRLKRVDMSKGYTEDNTFWVKGEP